MNRNDFRNPLIQSGIILLCAFILISIVVNSPASGFFSGIAAIIYAILKTILFIFGLSIALICSIAVLIGIYLTVTYFYSSDRTTSLFTVLKENCTSVYTKFRKKSYRSQRDDTISESIPSDLTNQHQAYKNQQKTYPPEPAPVPEDSSAGAFEEQLEQLNSAVMQNTKQLSALMSELNKLKETVDAKQLEQEPGTDTPTDTLDSNAHEMESIQEQLETMRDQVTGELQTVKKELANLQKKTAIPETVSGILSYIDAPADREKLTQKVEEAVSRGMTYSQADELFKKSLSPKIYKILTAHPRLTKDFIRAIKKKFA